MKFLDDPVLDAIAHRRSVSKVGPNTPSDEEIATLLAAVTHVADHKALRPWRLILLRGEDRLTLARALDAAQGIERESGEVNPKPFRAELLIALVASPVEHEKVPTWEQHATAAGVGHLLELALWQAGWGVMWRTGTFANAQQAREAHGLADSELLMGWLYVGDIDSAHRQRLGESNRPPLDPIRFIGRMPREGRFTS